MRDQGRLVEWFDDKGYGFIQPNDSTKDRVFLHIKDFSRPGPRPIVGCALDYVVILDERGRFRAQQVHYLKASQAMNASVCAVVLKCAKRASLRAKPSCAMAMEKARSASSLKALSLRHATP